MVSCWQRHEVLGQDESMIENDNSLPGKKIGDNGRPDESAAFTELSFTQDFDIRIAADGAWYYRGSKINRWPLVKLFSTVLRRENDGTFWLVTPAERGRIEVEDAPFVAVELSAEGSGPGQTLAFRTNVGDWVEADAGHPIRVEEDTVTGAPRPYIGIRDGLEALLLRPVFYDLVERAEKGGPDGGQRLGVWSRGCFFPLGPAA
jgi:hypothetical protein